MRNFSLANVLHSTPVGRGTLFLQLVSFRNPSRRRSSSSSSSSPLIRNTLEKNEQLLVVVGGGAAGIYASIRAKSIAPLLKVLVIEKGKPLAKVKISGGGRCNVTNGHFVDSERLVENYPRGNKELRGPFFKIHGPEDTMSWFSTRDVKLKTEDDGRVFPISNNSASIVDCLLNEAKHHGVGLQVGKTVSNVLVNDEGQFLLKVEKRTMELVEYIKADYLLMATGSAKQGHKIALQLGHSIVEPMPSLFSFKIEDPQLASLSGVSFPRVKAKLKLEKAQKNVSEFTQVGPMLVTHWGLSGPVILRLSAWGARELFRSNYTGVLLVDFIPDIHLEDVKRIFSQHKAKLAKHKACNSFPSEFDLVKRFWKYLLQKEGIDEEKVWASISNSHLNSMASLLKQCQFKISGKGQYKDEFVTAGGVPLSEISLSTMESKIKRNLFFAGEILNIDGLTGGFNFQNAWTGGYIAGTEIGQSASTIERQRTVGEENEVLSVQAQA